MSSNSTETSNHFTGVLNSRREFFAKSSMLSLGVLAFTTLGHSSKVFANTTLVSSSTSDDINILNTALAHEYQAITAYQVGAESGLLQKPVLEIAVKFQDHHKSHAKVLASTIEKLGGIPVEAKSVKEYDFPLSKLKSQADVLHFAAGLEQAAASAYLGALPKFYNKNLITAAGSILGDETMHWAILLNALGEDPVPNAFIG